MVLISPSERSKAAHGLPFGFGQGHGYGFGAHVWRDHVILSNCCWLTSQRPMQMAWVCVRWRVSVTGTVTLSAYVVSVALFARPTMIVRLIRHAGLRMDRAACGFLFLRYWLRCVVFRCFLLRTCAWCSPDHERMCRASVDHRLIELGVRNSSMHLASDRTVLAEPFGLVVLVYVTTIVSTSARWPRDSSRRRPGRPPPPSDRKGCRGITSFDLGLVPRLYIGPGSSTTSSSRHRFSGLKFCR